MTQLKALIQTLEMYLDETGLDGAENLLGLSLADQLEILSAWDKLGVEMGYEFDPCPEQAPPEESRVWGRTINDLLVEFRTA